jgi:hypothetical protein
MSYSFNKTMDSKQNKEIPKGLYVISVINFLAILDIVYDTITNSIPIYLTLLTVPVLVYIGIGVIKKWPNTRNILITVVVLTFAGAISQLILAYFVDANVVIDTKFYTTILLGTLIPIFTYLYVRKEEVRIYFD